MIHLRVLYRHLKNNKVYFLNNVLGLAIGLACAIIIMLWVQHETGFDHFHKNLDRLYRVCFYTDTNNQEGIVYHNFYMPGGLAEIMKDRYPEIKEATHFANANAVLSFNDKTVNSHGKIVHSDFMDMFSFPVIAGDPVSALASPDGIVITRTIANRLFGDKEPIGKTIKLDNSMPFTVAGIMENPPRNSVLQFDFLVPYEAAPPYMKSTKIKTGEMFVLLDTRNDMQAVDKKIVNAYNDLNPGEYPNYLFLQPFSRIHLYALDGHGGRITYVYIFSLLALFVLGMACINFINLSTARASIRFREIAVKKVIGAGRRQLVIQFMLESFFYSFIALLSAIIVVKLAMPHINTLLGEQLQFNISRNWLSLLIITTITGLAAGSYPAFFMSGLVPVKMLKGNASNYIYARPSTLRRLLVTVQFTLAIFFVICITVIYTQLNYFQTKSLGFDHKNLVVLPLNREATEKSDVIKAELQKIPSITHVSVTLNNMTTWQADAALTWPGKKENDIFSVGMNRVDSDFLKTFNLEMAEGRFFSPDFPSDLTNACIVNEEAVKAMGMTDPIGQRVTWAKGSGMDMSGKIIGVIKNYHTQSLHNPIRPFVLFDTEQGQQLYIKIKPGQTREALLAAESTIKTIVPEFPFSYSFLDDELYQLYRVEIFTKTIILYITILAVIITLLGLFGLASFNTARRTKEIGIRKILGATAGNIVTDLSREFVLLGMIAMVISCPAAFYAMHKWLQNFAYRADLTIWPFALAGLLILLLTVLTIGGKALQVFIKNPVNALHYE